MAFTMWDASTNGTQQGSTLTFDGVGSHPPPVSVVGGLFTAALDFGASPYAANQTRCLETIVNGQMLSPRQLLTPAP